MYSIAVTEKATSESILAQAKTANMLENLPKVEVPLRDSEQTIECLEPRTPIVLP